MALIHCPDCGAQVSDTAVVCSQCGFPLRREVLAAATAGRAGRRGADSGINTAGLVIGVVVAGFVGVVIVGILAALAIPRFAQASARAREREGELLLRQAFTLENAYYASNGAYAPTVDELRSVGWAGDSTRYCEVEVRLDPATSALACLEARPKRGADVQPLSMDSAGQAYHDAGCAGETLRESRTAATQPPDADVPGEGGDAGARTLLREVYAGVVEYRAENGRDPTEVGQVLRHVHFTRASNENDLTVGRWRGSVCVAAVPKWLGPDHHPLSIDGHGRMYDGLTCTGTVLEQVDDAPPPADSSATSPAAKPET
jgi:type II secretory pathway pseudopilin PulG